MERNLDYWITYINFKLGYYNEEVERDEERCKDIFSDRYILGHSEAMKKFSNDILETLLELKKEGYVLERKYKK